MYRIVHSMNNNVALAKDNNGEELMLIGNGIAFGKKKGDIIVEQKIDKVFKLRTEEIKENFVALLKNIPLDFITVTCEVIDKLSKKYDYPIQDYLYITLPDHIYCSYQAIIQKRYKESDLPDVSEKYPNAYKIAEEALQIYRERLLDAFPDDEVSRIAYHFINAEGEKNQKGQGRLDKRKDILYTVEVELQQNGIKRTQENCNFYDRFMVHLNYFLDYLDRNKNNNLSLLEMEEQVKHTYPEAYQIACNIYEILSHKIGSDLYSGEKVYLALHIQRLL